MRAPITPPTATEIPANAAMNGGGDPVTKEISPAELRSLNLQAPLTSVSSGSANSAVTVIDHRPAGLAALTLGPPPSGEPSNDMPVIGGALEEAPHTAENVSPSMMGLMIQTDPGGDPMSGLGSPVGSDKTTEAPPDVTIPSKEAEPPRDVTVRVARVDLEEQEDRAAIKQGPDKKILIAAAAGLAVVGIVVAIALKGGGDTVTVTDAGTGAGEVAQADAGGSGTENPVVAVNDVVDAGTRADPVDVATPPAANDAGPAETNPMEFGTDGGEGEGDGPSVVKRQRRPDNNKADDEIKAVRVAMGKKGFLPGDVPAIDDLLKKAVAASRSKPAEAEKLAKDAKAAIDAKNVDRAFVLDKLARFNKRYDKSKRPDIADKVEPLARDAASAFAAGRYDDANKKLNQALILVGKK
jgi:hypothetical protein